MSANTVPTTLREETVLREELAKMRHTVNVLHAKLAEEHATRERLQHDLDLRNAALDAASSHFMIVDARQQHRPIVYVNRALAVQHGYRSAEELIGKSVSLLMGKHAFSSLREEFRRELDEGRSVRFEMETSRRDGSTFWVGFSATPLRNAQGEITHHVSLGADITARLEADRKQRELRERLYEEMRERERIAIELRLAQKLEAVGRLAAGVAHEINTPIQYIGDSVDFLRSAFGDLARLFNAYRDAIARLCVHAPASSAPADLRALETEIDFEFLSQEVPKAFERTLEGTERVAGIVRAMKEFAHPDANEQSPADLNRALETTLTVARNEYKYAATISIDFAELPPVVCSVGELNQVFLNLIVNAAHAIHDAGRDATTGRITIRTRLDEDHVEIAIGDNGCGIAAENLDKIFDPFFTTKEVGRGTGQGLAICRSIVVDKHAGRIDVHSERGVGTQFIVRLPVEGRSGR